MENKLDVRICGILETNFSRCVFHMFERVIKGKMECSFLHLLKNIKYFLNVKKM